jgi:hypothetical protein
MIETPAQARIYVPVNVTVPPTVSVCEEVGGVMYAGTPPYVIVYSPGGAPDRVNDIPVPEYESGP